MTLPKRPQPGIASLAMHGMRGLRSGRLFAPELQSSSALRAPAAWFPRLQPDKVWRKVLNALPGKPRVISTRGEFDSIDVILKQYAALDRIELRWIESDADGNFTIEPVMHAVNDGNGAELVVISQVMFMTGQIVRDLDTLANACHQRGTRLLVDSYHAVGVVLWTWFDWGPTL